MDKRNKNLLIGLVIVVVAVLLGLYLAFRYKANTRELPNGTMGEQSTTINPSATPSALSTRPQVTINTSKGDIVIELRPDVAPKTVTNFLTKWANGYCDNKIFHRVEDWVVQGCDPAGNGMGGNTTLPTETSSESFVAGAVGVARLPSSKDFSNDSQFFILKRDTTSLNGDYTYFGKVISGMDVVNKLSVGDKILSTTILSK